MRVRSILLFDFIQVHHTLLTIWSGIKSVKKRIVIKQKMRLRLAFRVCRSDQTHKEQPMMLGSRIIA
jgi:hypothetical protein